MTKSQWEAVTWAWRDAILDWQAAQRRMLRRMGVLAAKTEEQLLREALAGNPTSGMEKIQEGSAPGQDLTAIRSTTEVFTRTSGNRILDWCAWALEAIGQQDVTKDEECKRLLQTIADDYRQNHA